MLFRVRSEVYKANPVQNMSIFIFLNFVKSLYEKTLYSHTPQFKKNIYGGCGLFFKAYLNLNSKNILRPQFCATTGWIFEEKKRKQQKTKRQTPLLKSKTIIKPNVFTSFDNRSIWPIPEYFAQIEVKLLPKNYSSDNIEESCQSKAIRWNWHASCVHIYKYIYNSLSRVYHKELLENMNMMIFFSLSWFFA